MHFSRTSLTNLGLGFSKSTVKQSDLGGRANHTVSRGGDTNSKTSALRFLTSHPSSTGTGSCSGGEKTSCSVWRQSGRQRFACYCQSGSRGSTGPECEGRGATLPVYAGGVHSVEPHVQHLSGLGQLTVSVKGEQAQHV